MRSKIRTYILFIALGVLMSSCITSRKTNYLQDSGIDIEQYKRIDSMYLHDDYRLQVGDQIYFQILSTSEEAPKIFGQSGTMQTNMQNGLMTYKVYSDSCIDFPFIGPVKVVGHTTRETKEVLEKALEDYVPNCNVEVWLAKAKFTVIGPGNTGTYDMPKERLTIFEALSVAGDLKPLSDRKKIHLLRKKDGKTIVKTFDVRSKDIIGSEYYYIEPNDVIYVPNITGQFFSITSFSALLSTITSAISFGVLIYSLSNK